MAFVETTSNGFSFLWRTNYWVTLPASFWVMGTDTGRFFKTGPAVDPYPVKYYIR
jgi:hypothetical protein